MLLNLQSTKTLSNGVEMPRFGLGVYKMTEREETLQAIDKALQYGYRAIDTASLYGNEVEVGEAIRHSGIRREDILLQQKYGIMTKDMMQHYVPLRFR